MRFWIWTLCIAPLFAEEESRPNPAEPLRAIRNEPFVVASLLYRKTEDGITLPHVSGKTAHLRIDDAEAQNREPSLQFGANLNVFAMARQQAGPALL